MRKNGGSFSFCKPFAGLGEMVFDIIGFDVIELVLTVYLAYIPVYLPYFLTSC